MLNKRNAVNIILVIVLLSTVVMSGCSSNHTTDKGGETEIFVGFKVNHKPAPASTTVSIGPKTTTGTVTPVATSFNDSRSKVASAEALRNKILHQFEGPGAFQGSSNVSNAVASEATRLINGQ